MRELNVNEVEAVNGGIAPLVFAILATDMYMIGITAGFLTGYSAVKNYVK